MIVSRQCVVSDKRMKGKDGGRAGGGENKQREEGDAPEEKSRHSAGGSPFLLLATPLPPRAHRPDCVRPVLHPSGQCSATPAI